MKSYLVASALVLGSTSAYAFQDPKELAEHARREVADGPELRVERFFAFEAPFATRAALRRFEAAYGSWKGSFDTATGVPIRLGGVGISVPGAQTSPALAEKAARTILAEHLDLLAPGTDPTDFVLAENRADGSIRTVTFLQRHLGLEVLGGAVSFRFQKDRLFVLGSDAWPNVRTERLTQKISDVEAIAAAQSWMARDFAPMEVQSVGMPVILPLVRASGSYGYQTVRAVVLSSKEPRAQFTVFVDAATGTPVAREQTLRFFGGSVHFDTPDRYPAGTRSDHPAPFLTLNVDGWPATSDAQGQFAVTASVASEVRMSVVGPSVRVVNNAGTAATKSFAAPSDGQTLRWTARTQELEDAQLTTFVSAQRAKDFARSVAPNMTYLDDQLEANVNMSGECNAYSDGVTINFFRKGQCENTGRIPDVVYHEFGHGVHFHAIIRGAGSFDTSLSEGGADYMSAAITLDPGMGRGFFGTSEALRDLDPRGTEASWPNDVDRDPHITGLIFAGAMWDLRKAFIASEGEAQGTERANQYWLSALERASDIPSTYLEVLAADDTDGNLANGSPNFCTITSAFAAHGLADPADAGPVFGAPTLDGLTVSVGVPTSRCGDAAVTSAELRWRVRGQSASGSVPMTISAQSLSATIPTQAPGVTVEYQLVISLGGGQTVTLPRNIADPWYQTFIGVVTPIYCTDFETSPEGWNHELKSGRDREGADDWTLGTPFGTSGSGDPGFAYSGTKVYGNDLGGGNFNGKYQPNKVNALKSPSIDVSGHANVRLQYRRWLTIEDGHFDRGTIWSNAAAVWQNLDGGENGQMHHEDREWVFQDIDVTPTITNGQVTVEFELATDGSGEYGGWNIDDFCLVAYDPEVQPRCGDGKVGPGETCDDANTDDGDACRNDCTLTPVASCGDGITNGTEACDDANTVDNDACSNTCTLPSTTCGDGNVDSNEACDLGAQNGLGTCTNTCQLEGPSENEPKTITDSEGCNCSSTETNGSSRALWALGLAGILGLRRRRRR